ncbi:MAG: hypothetical protein ABI555_08985 [Chloroflexota bacterium]
MIGLARARTVVASGLLAVLVLASGGAGAPTAFAASNPVKLVGQTTYAVRPDEHRLAVTIQITATSLLRDTTTRRFYVDRAYLAVYPAATNFRLAGSSGKPVVSVSSRSATNLVLLLKFGSRLGSGKSTVLTLTFDIEDPGGAPDRSLRISPSLLSFPVWAYGSPGVPGSAVRVEMPGEYVASIGRGPLEGPVTAANGTVSYTSGTLASPTAFVAEVLADRPGVLTDDLVPVSMPGGTIELRIRAWPDDPDWQTRVSDLLERALPILGSRIGLPWPTAAPLEVRETIARDENGAASIAGRDNAAVFDPAASRLDVPFTADASAIVHGVAHAWFTAELIADRWIADGFALLYAELTGAAIDVPVTSPTSGEATPVPLNAWVVGSPEDDYGYGVALLVAREIAATAGDVALQQVWNDAAAGVSAYQPTPVAGASAAALEHGAGRLDWRSLLDLLEARTGMSFEGLWRGRVIRWTDGGLLDARQAARGLYRETTAAAGSWVLPRRIRDEMTAWQFNVAIADLLQAADVLGQRDDIEEAAVAVGLAPPVALREAFEGTEGLDAAAAEAVTERAVIGAFAEILDARPQDPGLVTKVGLFGEDPDAEIAAARTAFAVGDLDATVRHAETAKAIWAGAPDLGRERVASAIGLAIAVLLLLWLVVSRIARWRRGRTGRMA